ncbi:anti-sigma-28 factor, FlgM family [Lachnospiraceae bacterium]|nr:anti-sigma-28 factor, FlgM family [Lachnospiraceae bacterium]
MRVEAYTQVQQVYGSRKTSKINGAEKVRSGRDAVEISGLGQNIQAVKKAVSESSDIREELTAPLKAKIQNGEYDVSGESFADKLIEKLGM